MVLLFGAFLRLWDLEATPLSTAELAAVATARLPAAELLPRLRDSPWTAPLGVAALRAATAYGLREESVRLPAAVAGVAALAVALLLLADLFGRRAGLTAGLVLAAAPLSVAAARSALPAGIAAAATLLAAWLLWRLLRRGAGVVTAAGGAAVALYSGYAAFAALAAGLAAALAGVARGRRRAALRLLAATVTALLLFLPWAAFDLPSEPGGEMTPPPDLPALAADLPRAVLFGEPPRGGPPAVQRGAAWVVLALAVAGAALALRRRPAAAVFSLVLLVVVAAGALGAARLGPRLFLPLHLLAALPLYLGLAAYGLDRLLGRLLHPGPRSVVLGALAVAFVAAVELPAAAAPEPDWRTALEVVGDNLGPETRVVAPLAKNAVAFYAPELERRLPGSYSLHRAAGWMWPSREVWVVSTFQTRLHPDWRLVQEVLNERASVDLSPDGDPALLFVARTPSSLYLRACSFVLPAATIARGTFLRDCLLWVGARDGPLRQAAVLSAATGVGLRNPSLLQAVTALVEADRLEAARGLADAIAAREPDWLPARQAQAAVRERLDAAAQPRTSARTSSWTRPLLLTQLPP